MEKIRVRSKNLYVIEVNDAGETIEFDITDIELPFKLERTKQKIDDVRKWLKAQQIIISKQQDTAKKGDIMTVKERATVNAYRDAFKKMRAAIDEFAGEGASQKIFGSQNYLEMFNDFMEAMLPHFEKMKINGEETIRRIEEKYSNKADDEI